MEQPEPMPEEFIQGRVSGEQMARFREYAWSHFAYHAEQRMKCFNYFVLLISAITAGTCAIFAKAESFGAPALLVFGLLMMVFSLQFSKLDQRNKQLVDLGREALKVLDTIEVSFFKNESTNTKPVEVLDLRKLRLMEIDDVDQHVHPDRISHAKVFKSVFEFCKSFGFVLMIIGLFWLCLQIGSLCQQINLPTEHSDPGNNSVQKP